MIRFIAFLWSAGSERTRPTGNKRIRPTREERTRPTGVGQVHRLRRAGPFGPASVNMSLGRKPLGRRRQLYLVRAARDHAIAGSHAALQADDVAIASGDFDE